MKVFGLIGNPVGHSLSPILHESAYNEYNLDARYATFEPAPEDIEVAIHGAEALGIQGLNVTIPFKEQVLEFVEPDSLAQRIDAVNTIDFSCTPPRGHNTDATGAVRAFEHHDITLENATVLLVGAGGAGKAIAHGLNDAGAILKITNRTEERARTLAESIDDATSHRLSEIPEIASNCEILINTTSVGMGEEESLIPADCITKNHVVMDVVYHPIQTTLLKSAIKAGAVSIDGGWMLLYQGAESFEIWTGKSAPIATMNEALRERL